MYDLKNLCRAIDLNFLGSYGNMNRNDTIVYIFKNSLITSICLKGTVS